jgi:hypothetical protein
MRMGGVDIRVELYWWVWWGVKKIIKRRCLRYKKACTEG